MACVLFPMTIATGMAQAQGMGGASQAAESGVTAYGGYRSSSSLTETTTGQNVNVNTGASYALAVDIGLDRNRQVEIFYGRQKTELTSGGRAPSLLRSWSAASCPRSRPGLAAGSCTLFRS